MKLSLWFAAAMSLALLSVPATAVPPNGRPEYGVYCVQGRLTVEQKQIEELKRVFGGDVCRLDQDPSLVGAREKVQRLGGTGAGCSCEM
jgi:hypothetical protein